MVRRSGRPGPSGASERELHAGGQRGLDADLVVCGWAVDAQIALTHGMLAVREQGAGGCPAGG